MSYHHRPPTHTHTHAHTHTHTHTHACTPPSLTAWALLLSLTHSLTHPLTHPDLLTLFHWLTQSLTHSVTHTHYISGTVNDILLIELDKLKPKQSRRSILMTTVGNFIKLFMFLTFRYLKRTRMRSYQNITNEWMTCFQDLNLCFVRTRTRFQVRLLLRM